MTSNEQRGLDAATNVLLLKAHKLSARELAESAIAAYLEATSLREDAGIPSPQDHVVGLEQIGCITEGGAIEWFKPPIRKGTALYAAPGSTLKPEEIECVCKRDVCTYDHDFGCGLDRSKERQDV